MKIGIIGLPGSGKTTLWNLLTETYDPGEAVAFSGNRPRMKTVKVRDARLERLRDDYDPKKYIPAQIEVFDFPAVRKEGIDRTGMADLLAPARDMEALIAILRAFQEPGGPPPDPARDLAEIAGELLISDLVIVERRLERLEAQLKKHIAKTFDEDRREKELLLRVKADLEAEKPLFEFKFTPEEKKKVGSYQFLSAKPRVVVLNLGDDPASRNLAGAVGGALRPGEDLIPIAARAELEVLQLPEEERGPFLAEFGIEELARDKAVAASYRAAGRHSFFTAGEDEVRAWTIRIDTSALEAAGEIHSDIQRGFIRAEVVAYEDYVKDGGIKGAKEKGHFRLEGKEYVVRDGDIIEFRHGG
jgi:GTP-binding protein YchF